MTTETNFKTKPLKKNIIVEHIEKEKITESGIILSSADPAEVTKAVILAIGSTVDLVKVGDIILPDWNKAKKSKIDGEDYYVVSEDDIVLVFED